MRKKYELLPKESNGLHRIRALRDFGDVKETCLGCKSVWGRFWSTLTREKPFKCTICGSVVSEREYTEWRFTQ